MRILVVNAGSSSLKLAVVDGDERVASQDQSPWDGSDTAPIAKVAASVPVDAVGHRIVHGGPDHSEPVVVDEATVAQLVELSDLAPLHQPPAIAALRAARRALPHVAHVACFDTAFHATIPPAASTFAVAAAWRRRWPLRRFGFHGLSHAYAAGRAADLVGRPLSELRMVTAHLGSGASLCAVAGGRSVDTTMGFTPLDGLVMANRSGSVDPGLLLWLAQPRRLPLAELADGLERRAGLAGLADRADGSGDLRLVLADRDRGLPEARLAVDVYVHRLRREIAAMTAALGGLDVLVFTGGVGEHQPTVRAAAASGLAFLGVAVDPAANAAAGADSDISAPGAPVRTLVVTAREDLAIADLVRDTLVGGTGRPGG